MEVIEAPSAVLNPSSQLCAYQCSDDKWSLITKQARNKDIGERITLKLSIPNPRGYFKFLSETCVNGGGCKNAYANAAQGSTESDLQTSTLSSIFTMASGNQRQTLEACYGTVLGVEADFMDTCLTHREARVEIQKLDNDLMCSDYCARGICQFDDISRYADGVVGCTAAGPCAGDGTCSVPGPRYGHASSSFKYRGGVSTLIIFGGEMQTSGGTTLRNDVTIGSFQGTSMTYARLNILCTPQSPCPRPRRDASIAMIDNRGGSSGKLIVFGGMEGRGKDYFDNNMEFVQVLNDLWVLNLDQIHQDGQGDQCLFYARCSVKMRWGELEVPGDRPTSRFGASLAVLDQFAEGILHLADGAAKQIENNVLLQTSDVDDLYVFQLHDPFFKFCAVTGKGLTQAIAGRTTTFNIACTDILGEPANGAEFRVTIAGGPTCAGCPSVFPPVIGIGEGLYECKYVPITAGEYVLSVKVGRGGLDFQDLVGGDSTATASTVQADIIRHSKGNGGLKEFELLVSSGPTSRRTSTAEGDAVTLATAGVSSTFSITSVDDFQNLRPGGDDMSVVFRLAGSLDIPNAGKVSDNNDGSYLVQYAITQAGRYTVSISVNGVVGVGSPFELKVEAQLADTALTYSYGEFFDASTGKTSSIYVQTRDKYGNFISTDPTLFPAGSDDVKLEYCRSVVLGGACAPTNTLCACQGGTLNPDVSIIITYGEGVNGATRNGQLGGEPYYGLYKITYFPFTSGKSTPLIRHNGEYIRCYFHTGTPVYEVALTDADICVQDVIIKDLVQSSTSTTRVLGGLEPVSSLRTHPLTWNSPAQPARPSFQRGWQVAAAPPAADGRRSDGEAPPRSAPPAELPAPPAGVRRALTQHFDATSDDSARFAVKQTFSPPDTGTARSLATVVPGVCFLVGAGIVIIQWVVDFYRWRKQQASNKVRDEYFQEMEAKGISVKSELQRARSTEAQGQGGAPLIPPTDLREASAALPAGVGSLSPVTGASQQAPAAPPSPRHLLEGASAGHPPDQVDEISGSDQVDEITPAGHQSDPVQAAGGAVGRATPPLRSSDSVSHLIADCGQQPGDLLPETEP